jgi:Subtilase family
MQEVQDFFYPLRYDLEENYVISEEERVKIAILDTGLDMSHPILRDYRDRGQIGPKQSCDFVAQPQDCDSETKVDIPVSEDSTGHGTHCTHLLLKTCPTARVYVAKVLDANEVDADIFAKRVADVGQQFTSTLLILIDSSTHFS